MDTIDNDQLLDLMRNRQQVYALLARLFEKEIDEGLFVQLRDGDILDCHEGSIGEALDMMRGYLRGDGACTLDLARDYAKAFCGAGSTKRNSAYPFESVYTSKEGYLMQEARDQALAWYHRFGLGKSDSWNDCEDHVALELEFVAYLAGKCVEALEAAGQDGDAQQGGAARVKELLDAQRAFVGEHLVNWLPEFDRDVDHKARTDFYRGLARLTSHYAKEDLALLESLCAA